MTTYVLLAVGLATFAILARLVFDRRRTWGWRAFFLILLLPIAAGATLAGALHFSSEQGIAPSEMQRTLFAGVQYTRSVVSSQRPQVTHVVRIDLGTKGLSFLVTPGDAGKLLPLQAKTASEFLAEHKLELGIVSGQFAPGYAKTPWEEPLASSSFVRPNGRTVSRTVEYGKGDAPSTLYFTDKNEATIGRAPANVYNALTGDCVLVGDKQNLDGCPFAGDRVARSAAGLDATGKILTLVVVDGHRKGVAEGMSAVELGAWLQTQGLVQAVQLGAGPQAELVWRNEEGDVVPLSIPMGSGTAGSERRVGAVLGVQAVSRISAP